MYVNFEMSFKKCVGCNVVSETTTVYSEDDESGYFTIKAFNTIENKSITFCTMCIRAGALG